MILQSSVTSVLISVLLSLAVLIWFFYLVSLPKVLSILFIFPKNFCHQAVQLTFSCDFSLFPYQGKRQDWSCGLFSTFLCVTDLSVSLCFEIPCHLFDSWGSFSLSLLCYSSHSQSHMQESSGLPFYPQNLNQRH